MILLILVLVIGSVVAIGRWRKFGSIQWIWAIAGLGIGLFVIWALVLVFFIGPEMNRAIVPWK